HRHVRRRIGGEDYRIEGKLSLPGEHCRYAVTPSLLDGGQDAQLVVHQHVVLSGIPLLDILQGLLFVDINKDVAFDSLENAGTLDLARLEHHIAVREDDRPAPLAETFQHVEGAGIEPVGEWVINQEVGCRYQVWLVGVLNAKALESPQIIAVAQLLK